MICSLESLEFIAVADFGKQKMKLEFYTVNVEKIWNSSTLYSDRLFFCLFVLSGIAQHWDDVYLIWNEWIANFNLKTTSRFNYFNIFNLPCRGARSWWWRLQPSCRHFYDSKFIDIRDSKKNNDVYKHRVKKFKVSFYRWYYKRMSLSCNL